MHVISRKRLREFEKQHAESREVLDTWFRIIHANEFENFAALRKLFPSVDRVGKLYIFNIGGNKFWLIAAIHFNRQKIFVRQILTHAEYSKGKWQDDDA